MAARGLIASTGNNLAAQRFGWIVVERQVKLRRTAFALVNPEDWSEFGLAE